MPKQGSHLQSVELVRGVMMSSLTHSLTSIQCWSNEWGDMEGPGYCSASIGCATEVSSELVRDRMLTLRLS